jgi:integrase/recombinase XerC
MDIQTQRTFSLLSQEHYIELAIDSFIRDRKASNLSPLTLKSYKSKLHLFTNYCEQQEIKYVTQITADTIRSYMLYMVEVRHNSKGNIFDYYRCIRCFLYWYEREFEPENWKNPIRKITAPRQSQIIIEPISFEDISALLETCDDSFLGCRDKAIILSLLDTGARAQEFLNINLKNIDELGGITIEHGKGDKSRKCYIGRTTKRVVRKYLRMRNDRNPALWISNNGDRLTYDGLRALFTRRSKVAKIPTPTIHGFRRAFALSMLRSNIDIFSLQKLLGHSSMIILRTYLAQNDDDTKQAHIIGSPVDNHF